MRARPRQLPPPQGSGYSVSLFTDWRESRFNEAWIKTVAASRDVASSPSTFYAATRAIADVHPLPRSTAENLCRIEV
jgi:alditol oxidase